MNLKQGLLLAFISLITFSASAQLNKAEQKMYKKAQKCYKKGRFVESSENLKPLLQKYPLNQDLWLYYQKALFKNYQKNYKGGTYKVTVSEDDSAARQKAERLAEVWNLRLEEPKMRYHFALMDATLYSPFQERASLILRNEYVDTRYYSDSNINEASRNYFLKASGEMRAENYEMASYYFSKALEEDSTNYEAVVQLGETYYKSEYFGKAAAMYRKAIAMQPNMIEPMKYLADALINKKKFAEARKLLTESLLIYPEESMFKRLDYVKTSMDGGHLNRKWILRIARINQVEPHVLRTDFFEDALHFQHYTDGGLQVKDNYSVKGIKVEPNNEALSPYLEIESWRRMLKATEGQDIPALEYARFMEERGMLEPYVFISLFSIEFYDQYLHFIENNRPLAEKYIEDYLMGA